MIARLNKINFILCLLAINHISFSAPVAKTPVKPAAKAVVVPKPAAKPAVKPAVATKPAPKPVVPAKPVVATAAVAAIAAANQILAITPPTVVKTGSTIIPGVDPHDYISFAPYWWPCPGANPTGYYYRQDGVRNNELVNKGDAPKFHTMAQSVVLLTRAYDKTKPDSKKYADKAAEFLKTWFINPDTKMNPNLNNAQIINGPHNATATNTSCVADAKPKSKGGTKSGILELRYMISVVAVLPMLKESGAINDADYQSLTTWISDYYLWLTTSKLGIEEGQTDNNHATWYDAQVISIAVFLGKNDEARTKLNKAKDKITSQIRIGGLQAEELSRTRALTYSLFNLQAFYVLAVLGDKLGVDLWNYPTKQNSAITSAYNFIKQYKGQCATGKNCKWGPSSKYKQLDAVEAWRWEVLDPANRNNILYNIIK